MEECRVFKKSKKILKLFLMGWRANRPPTHTNTNPEYKKYLGTPKTKPAYHEGRLVFKNEPIKHLIEHMDKKLKSKNVYF